MVVRESVAQGRRAGSWTALGVGCGIFVHVAYSLLGIGLIVSQSIVLFNLFAAGGRLSGVPRLASAAGAADEPGGDHGERSGGATAWQAFVVGFVTNGLNPKATLFFLSLFTVVISADTPLWVQAGYGVYLAGATALWFCWWPGCSAEAACVLALRAWATGSIG